MKVSNYRAYWTREYKKNGEVITAPEGELSQIYTLSLTSQNAMFKAYGELDPRNDYGFPDDLLGSNTSNEIRGAYASFSPGYLYLNPEMYYTFEDFFDLSDIQDFVSDIQIKWTVNPRSSIEVFWLKNRLNNYSDDYFAKIQDKGKDAYIVPMLRYYLGRGSGDEAMGIPTKRPCYVSFGWFLSYIPPSQVYSSTNGKLCRLSDEVDGALEELEYDVDYRGENKMLAQGYNGDEYWDNTFIAIDEFFQQLLKVRIFPITSDNATIFWDVEKDGIWYFRSNIGGNGNFTNKHGLGFLFDISNAPFFPTKGFYGPGQNIYGYEDGTVNFRITKTGGPESNDINELLDPNDNDPGFGPGQSGGDYGGNGNYDNSSDSIREPSLPTLSASGVGLISIFNPSSSQLGNIASKLWDPDALEAIKQYFTSPMDSILGLSIIPVKPNTGITKEVYLGSYNTQVSANVVDSDYVKINCGSIPIDRYWGSYLDYGPYTKIKCYLPYIGEIDIDPDQVMEKTLEVIYYINVVTGDTVAILTADDSVFASAAGNCIRQLPISQRDYSSIIQNAVSAIGTVAGAIAGASTGSAVMAAAKTPASISVASARATENKVNAGASLIDNVMNSKMHYSHAGQIGTGSGQLGIQRPFLTIERPNLNLADNYKSFVGYPCNKTLLIGACNGFTQIEATRLSVPSATDEEIASIISILLEGVII